MEGGIHKNRRERQREGFIKMERETEGGIHENRERDL